MKAKKRYDAVGLAQASAHRLGQVAKNMNLTLAPRELTDERVATAIGWTEIKHWGGRGIRGRHPQRGGFEAVPRYTSRMDDAIRACSMAQATDFVFAEAELHGEERRLWDALYICEKLVAWKYRHDPGLT